MISRIHSKLGTAGLVVAIVALVVALTGAAFAAMPGLNGKQKKEVKKIAKQFAGQDGATGPQGPVGPQGPKGDTGPKGDKGDPGTNGTNGKNGTNGTDGEDGACSEANPECVAPSGSTETGAWAVGPQAGGSTIIPLSFNLQLPEAPNALHYVTAEGEERIFGPVSEEIENVPATICLGSVEEPTAPAGQVCVYAQEEEIAAFPGYLPVGGFRHLYVSGATFLFSLQAGDYAFGTWAVTAE